MLATLDLRSYAEELVDRARMAPSLHNAQPWAFRVWSNRIEVYADRFRGLPVLDPDGRQLLIGAGAALLGIRLGLRMLGVEPEVALVPGDEHGDLVAVVSVGRERLPTAEESRLVQQIPVRRTIGDPMDPWVPDAIRDELVDEAWAEDAQLTWLEEPSSIEALAHLVRLAERHEAQEPRFREERTRWTGRESPPWDSRPYPTHLSHGRSMERGPSIAVLSTGGDRPTSWLAAGQALLRVLLAARSHGLGAAYLNRPLELPDLRSRLRETVGSPGFPQVVLRFGHPLGGWPPATPRRPVADVLHTTSFMTNI